MAVEGPMADERYRLRGMTDLERAYRKQWVKDQVHIIFSLAYIL